MHAGVMVSLNVFGWPACWELLIMVMIISLLLHFDYDYSLCLTNSFLSSFSLKMFGMLWPACQNSQDLQSYYFRRKCIICSFFLLLMFPVKSFFFPLCLFCFNDHRWWHFCTPWWTMRMSYHVWCSVPVDSFLLFYFSSVFQASLILLLLISTTGFVARYSLILRVVAICCSPLFKTLPTTQMSCMKW